MRILIRNGSLVLEDAIIQANLVIDDTLISAITDEDVKADVVMDATNKIVIPGMIDIHLHGGAGFDFMNTDPQAIQIITDYHLSHGATSQVPTTVSASDEAIEDFLKRYQKAVNSSKLNARLLGIHLEGPYLSEDKKGAHQLDQLKVPSISTMKRWIETFPFISRVTIAPELDRDFELGKFLNYFGINASIGHSNAYGHIIHEAIENGYTSFTHLYNAMSSVMSVDGKKEAGVAEMALLEKTTYAEIIADGHHVPKELIQLAYWIKTPDYLIGVSDCLSPAGSNESRYYLGSGDSAVEIVVNGAAYLKNERRLAGSIASVDDLLRMFVSMNIPLIDAVKMLSLSPAKLLKKDTEIGSIRVHKKADIVILDESMKVEHVLCNGRIWK